MVTRSTCRWIIFWVVVLCLTPRHAWAVDDPDLDFHTIVTEHFYVHYYDGLEHVATRTAKIAEEAHEILTPRLEWVPAERTHVVVSDRSDTANGSARVFGRNVINVLAMPPDSDSVLGFYDDWLRVLVYHEYVHILHLDTIGGVAPYINAVVGKLVVPNQTMPRWYIEGLATYYESAITRGGRVDSSLFQTYIRTAALDRDLFTLGMATNSPTEWPQGTTPYLYGSFFLDYVIDHEGEAFAAAYNLDYGSRIIPWRINGIARDLSGKTFETWWGEWSAYESGKAIATRLAIQAAGRTPVELVTTEGGRNGQAQVDPKTGHITFYRFDFESEGRFVNVDPESGEMTTLFELEGTSGRGDWTPDGETFVFDRRGVTQNVYSYQDLWAWDRETDRFRRLTKGERAREPAVSPDGERVAFIRTTPGSSELVVMPLDRLTHKTVVAGASHFEPESEAYWQQVSTPAWSPDGRYIVYSLWTLVDEKRDLWLWDSETGVSTRLTNDFAVEFDPEFVSDTEIIFAGDRDRTFNIYAVDIASKEVRRLSRVVRGVFDPALSAQRQWIYVNAYTDQGFELARIPADGLPNEPAPSSIVDALEPVERPEVTIAVDPEPYQPLRWLAPQYILPSAGIVQSGSGLGFELAGMDLVGHHNWVLGTAILTGRELQEQSMNIGASYSYRGSIADIGLLARYREYPRLNSYFAGSEFVPFKEEERIGQMTVNYPLRSIEENISIGLFGRLEHTTFATDRPDVVIDPADLEPRDPEQGWFNEVGMTLRFSNLQAFPWSVSVEEGYNTRLSLSLEDPAIGSEFTAVNLTWSVDLFHPVPFIDRHVLALLTAGGVTSTESVSPQTFFVGGTRPQDVLSSVIFQNPTGGRPIRGHEPGALNGRRYITTSAQYRFPIWDADVGFGTLPVYFRRVKGAAFFDAGTANNGYLVDADTFLTGVGGELLVEMVFGYYLRGNLRLGYAHGLDELGISEAYFLYGGGF